MILVKMDLLDEMEKQLILEEGVSNKKPTAIELKTRIQIFVTLYLFYSLFAFFMLTAFFYNHSDLTIKAASDNGSNMQLCLDDKGIYYSVLYKLSADTMSVQQDAALILPSYKLSIEDRLKYIYSRSMDTFRNCSVIELPSYGYGTRSSCVFIGARIDIGNFQAILENYRKLQPGLTDGGQSPFRLSCTETIPTCDDFKAEEFYNNGAQLILYQHLLNFRVNDRVNLLTPLVVVSNPKNVMFPINCQVCAQDKPCDGDFYSLSSYDFDQDFMKNYYYN